MLRLLLDEHLSPDVADGPRRRERNLIVHALNAWENGNFLGLDDAAILREAAAQALTLVTYDRRTIPPLLKEWAESGQSHGGVIFVDEKTIPPSDVGGLVKALAVLAKDGSEWDWTDRICFLQR
ncbi:MAG: hypothetical protein ACLGQX_06750 [Acidobacteriota bacterium]